MMTPTQTTICMRERERRTRSEWTRRMLVNRDVMRGGGEGEGGYATLCVPKIFVVPAHLRGGERGESIWDRKRARRGVTRVLSTDVRGCRIELSYRRGVAKALMSKCVAERRSDHLVF